MEKSLGRLCYKKSILVPQKKGNINEDAQQKQKQRRIPKQRAPQQRLTQQTQDQNVLLQ